MHKDYIYVTVETNEGTSAEFDGVMPPYSSWCRADYILKISKRAGTTEIIKNRLGPLGTVSFPARSSFDGVEYSGLFP